MNAKTEDKFHTGAKVVLKRGFTNVRAGMSGRIYEWIPAKDSFVVHFDVEQKLVEIVVEKSQMNEWFHFLDDTHLNFVPPALRKWLKDTRS